jgi:hypothetical protein
VQDDLLVYEPTREIAASLNVSARAIWQLCRGRLSVDEIAAELAHRHGLPPHQLRLDVEDAIARFRDLGILRPARSAVLSDERTSPSA